MARAHVREPIYMKDPSTGNLKLGVGASVQVCQPGTTTPFVGNVWNASTGGVNVGSTLPALGSDGVAQFWLDTQQDVDLLITLSGFTTLQYTTSALDTVDFTSPTVADGSVTTAKLAPNAVTAAKMGAAAATGAALGPDVVTQTGGKITASLITQLVSLADLTNVTGSFSAGSGIRQDGSGKFKPSGLVFSATAYGVVGDNNNLTATANGAALDACIAAAFAAGDGSLVDLDWTGTAYLTGGHLIHKRLLYRGRRWNVSKLQNSAAAGTHLYQTVSFGSLTQTLHDYTMGEYEFSFVDHTLDGNKANNASGGHCMAIVGYGYYLDVLQYQNAHSAGLWCEWNQTGEPIGNGGSNHERAARYGQLWFINNDCANVAAVNTRLSQAKAAISGGQACFFGPGDSSFDYVEAYRDSSVAGIGINFGLLDFNTASYSSFDPFIGTLVVWLNHNKGVFLGCDSPVINAIHAEGANTCLEIACQGPRIATGHIFAAQAAGTEVKISSGGNSASINLNCLNSFLAGVTKLDVTGATLADAELNIYMDLGTATTVTATAGSLPTSARRLSISASNWGGATVTPGWLPLRTGSTTEYHLNWTQMPTQIGFYTKAGLPTTTDIPAGMAAVYKDSSGGTIKLYANDGGTLKSAALA